MSERMEKPADSSPVLPRRGRFRRIGVSVVSGLVLVVVFMALPGCYLARLGIGQLRVSWGQRLIGALLEEGALPADRLEALRLIDAIRRFGVDALGMDAGTSYTTYYDTGGCPVMYNVTASRADRLEAVTWWFPIAGTVAYKGFFSREDAVRERDYLERLGYDTLLSPVTAYSTLGWFRDPVLSTMLDDPPEVLAELILHEMTHATVYAPGQTDFNEELATVVGRAAATAFFVSREGPDGPTVRRQRARRADKARFGAWLRETRDALDAFYAGAGSAAEKRSGREALFAAARRRFADLVPSFETNAYAGFSRLPLNNAVILGLGRYNEMDDLLVRAEAKAGGVRELLRLARGWAGEPNPRAAVEAWLSSGRAAKAPS